jgi:glucose/arabinose dehydrogenase
MVPRAVKIVLLLLSFLTLHTPVTHGASPTAINLDSLILPENFTISIYSESVPGARSMALGERGTVFVGTRNSNGSVYAVIDDNNDKVADRVETIAKNLNMPNGVAVRGKDLYVAEVSRVTLYPNIEDDLKHPPLPLLIRDTFPTETHHGVKFIRFGPDGLLYIPVGAPCNLCDPDPLLYASLFRMKADGTHLEKFAGGIRNTVGFAWDPKTFELWFTDNGRDHMGENLPPDELNHAPVAGLDFGYPYCFGNRQPDPQMKRLGNCDSTTPPALSLEAHTAPLGLRFYEGAMFPKNYQGAILIAQHGSWNRKEPIGYKVSLVRLEKNKPKSYETFIEGWLKEGKPWGRPVDLLVLGDGSLLISDDLRGVIYRVSYKENVPQ